MATIDLSQVRSKQNEFHHRAEGQNCLTTIAAAEVFWIAYRPPPDLVGDVDRLLETHNESESVNILNARGVRSSYGHELKRQRIHMIRRQYGLASRYDRLHSHGLLTAGELGSRLNVPAYTQ